MKNKKYIKYPLYLLFPICILYPFLIFYLLTHNYSYRVVGLVFLLILVLKFFVSKKILALLIGLVLSAGIILLEQQIFLKLYPCFMNLGFFILFCSDKALPYLKSGILNMAKLLKLSLIISDSTLKDIKKHWTLFLFINTLISIFTVFSSLKVWTIYNGLISYILIGSLFIVEFIYYHFFSCRK